MVNRGTEQMDRHISGLEARLEKLRVIRSMLADDPALVTDLLDILLHRATNNGVAVPIHTLVQKSDDSARSQLERVVTFFEDLDNPWQTVRQLAEATGLTRNSINFLFYTSKHQDLFESQTEGPKRKLWRLKAKAIEKSAILPISKNAPKPKHPPASEREIEPDIELQPPTPKPKHSAAVPRKNAGH